MKALRLEGVTVRDIDIEDKLEELQRAVDGYIEVLTLVPGVAAMVVNEEGILYGMEINLAASAVANQTIVGPALVVGLDGENFCDISEDIARYIKRRWV